MAETRRAARVCVSAAKESPHTNRPTTESPDGGTTGPQGRGHGPRRYRYTTTTSYTLKLDSSSIGRESKIKVTLRRGGLRV